MRTLKWLFCIVTGHDWVAQEVPQPEFEGITFHDQSLCARCGADSRELWQIMDDDAQTIDLIYMRLASKEKRS